jgi:type VI secretion system secreted protein Hcp
MPLPFHMFIEGKGGGGKNIITDGGCEMEGREDTVLCYNVKHRIYIPDHRGGTKGRRLHTPVIVTKAFDKVSPLLYQAFIDQEKLWVRLNFYRISKMSPSGEEGFFEYVLKDALISEINVWMSTDFEKKTDVITYMEDISFVYREIWWFGPAHEREAVDEWDKKD